MATTLSPVPVEALAFEGMSETASWLWLAFMYGTPVLLLVCFCWCCVRCLNGLKPLPDVVALRRADQQHDPERGVGPYPTIEGYVDLNFIPSQPKGRAQ